EAAIDLIGSHGYQKTTVAEISRQAGYSPGLVTHRFGSKLRLLDAIIEGALLQFQRSTVPAAIGDAQGLEAVVRFCTSRLSRDAVSQATRAFYTVMGESLGPVSEIRPTFARANAQWREFVSEWVREGQREGTIREDVDPQTAAGLIVGLIRGLIVQWMIDVEAMDLDRLRDECERWLRLALGKTPT
ncbi:MAG: TetR/AcrR family transcriptional regulator, partial [Gammaproteobacteria bacterium]